MESRPKEGFLLAMPEPKEKNTLIMLLWTWLLNSATYVVFLNVTRKKGRSSKIPLTAVRLALY